MNTDLEKFHEQIDAYLLGELTTEDELLFEKTIKENPELEKEVAIHKELYAQFDDTLAMENSFSYPKEAQHLEETIQKVSKNHVNSDTNKSLGIFIPLAIVACMVIGVLLYSANGSSSMQELYVDNSNWENLPSLTSRSASKKELVKGQELFEEGKYADSYSLFKEIMETQDLANSSVLLYLGVSSLELGKYDESISCFDTLIASEAIDSSKGYWYKVLVYLKQDNKPEAIKVLNQILLDKNNYNYQKAKEILKKLE